MNTPKALTGWATPVTRVSLAPHPHPRPSETQEADPPRLHPPPPPPGVPRGLGSEDGTGLPSLRAARVPSARARLRGLGRGQPAGRWRALPGGHPQVHRQGRPHPPHHLSQQRPDPQPPRDQAPLWIPDLNARPGLWGPPAPPTQAPPRGRRPREGLAFKAHLPRARAKSPFTAEPGPSERSQTPQRRPHRAGRQAWGAHAGRPVLVPRSLPSTGSEPGRQTPSRPHGSIRATAGAKRPERPEGRQEVLPSSEAGSPQPQQQQQGLAARGWHPRGPGARVTRCRSESCPLAPPACLHGVGGLGGGDRSCPAPAWGSPPTGPAHVPHATVHTGSQPLADILSHIHEAPKRRSPQGGVQA